MQQYYDDGDNDLAAQPGKQDQAGREKKEREEGKIIAAQQSNPDKIAPGEIAIGINEEHLQDEQLKEPTEEEMDEEQNNLRDAMNDDSYKAPANKQVNGKAG